jgi:hypothetical protein
MHVVRPRKSTVRPRTHLTPWVGAALYRRQQIDIATHFAASGACGGTQCHLVVYACSGKIGVCRMSCNTFLESHIALVGKRLHTHAFIANLFGLASELWSPKRVPRKCEHTSQSKGNPCEPKQRPARHSNQQHCISCLALNVDICIFKGDCTQPAAISCRRPSARTQPTTKLGPRHGPHLGSLVGP